MAVFLPLSEQTSELLIFKGLPIQALLAMEALLQIYWHLRSKSLFYILQGHYKKKASTGDVSLKQS